MTGKEVLDEMEVIVAIKGRKRFIEDEKMLSDENYQILIKAIQEIALTEGKEFNSAGELLDIMKRHWDTITDFTTGKARNNAAELVRLQAEQPVQETELKRIKHRITELKG